MTDLRSTLAELERVSNFLRTYSEALSTALTRGATQQPLDVGQALLSVFEEPPGTLPGDTAVTNLETDLRRAVEGGVQRQPDLQTPPPPTMPAVPARGPSAEPSGASPGSGGGGSRLWEGGPGRELGAELGEILGPVAGTVAQTVFQGAPVLRAGSVVGRGVLASIGQQTVANTVGNTVDQAVQGLGETVGLLYDNREHLGQALGGAARDIVRTANDPSFWMALARI